MMIEYLNPRQGITVRITSEGVVIAATSEDSEEEIREAFKLALERLLALRQMEAA